MIIRIVFLSCVLFFCDGADEGEKCSVDGVQGICTIIPACASALEGLKRGNIPENCGFVGSTPIVCCVNKPVTATTQRPPVLTTPKIISTTLYMPETPIYDDPREKFDGCEDIAPSLTSKKTGQKAFDKCVDYQEQCVYPCKRAGFTNELSRSRNCHHGADELILGGNDTHKYEFPHMVLLGYGETDQSILWLCGGSIISEKFILSAAHCNASQKVIPLSQYIVPACLHVGDPVNDAKVLATGWGNLGPQSSISEVMQKVILQKFSTAECSAHYPEHRLLPRDIDPRIQICYGHRTKRMDTCSGDSGGPIQIKSKKIHCMYTVVGVTSFGWKCGGPAVPGIYTRVEYYVPWIESIVWP